MELMEYWNIGSEPIIPSFQYSIIQFLHIQLLAGVVSFDVFKNFCAEGDVGDALAGVVFVECDLVGFRATVFFAGEDLADLDELLPLDHAAVDRIENIRLLVLNRLLNGDDAMDMAAGERSVVDLTPLGRSEAAFYQTDVTADDRRHMLSGLQPVAIEHENAGICRGQYDVDVANGILWR